jgi:seryl-tRNA synthetase
LYFLNNQAALLELAIINWAIHKAVKKGYTPITTPDVTKTDVLEG